MRASNPFVFVGHGVGYIARDAARLEQSTSRIYAVVSRVPKGRVATYGQIALLAGLPRQARLVGYAMHSLPTDSDVPWHRVVNAAGKISLRADGLGHDELQAQLLQARGRALRGRRHPSRALSLAAAFSGASADRLPAAAARCGCTACGAFQPSGYCFFASSSETEPAMITSSPCFQFTGVATLCLAVSCSESITRSTSSKLRPVVIG